MVERVQGNNGSGKRVKSPITATSYTVASLQTATNSFSQEVLIGEGSLGRVYRADFPNGKVFMCYFEHEIICHISTVLNGFDVNRVSALGTHLHMTLFSIIWTNILPNLGMAPEYGSKIAYQKGNLGSTLWASSTISL